MLLNLFHRHLLLLRLIQNVFAFNIIKYIEIVCEIERNIGVRLDKQGLVVNKHLSVNCLLNNHAKHSQATNSKL